MKQGIHPKYELATVNCACGNTFQTHNTVGDMKVEICNVYHPYFSGKQVLLDTAGRIDKFRKKYGPVAK